MKRRIIPKILRWIFFPLVCLVTLLALIVAEENLRGKLEWEHYKRGLEAQGEHLDMAYFIPPPVPDAENFAMTPLFKSFYYDPETGKRDDHYRPQAWAKLSVYFGIDTGKRRKKQLSVPFPAQKHGSWQTGNPRDLVAWQAYYRDTLPELALTGSPEEDVITAISPLDGIFVELREGAKTRPLSRFEIEYEKGPGAGLPHYVVIQGLVDILSLRATAELRVNRADDAYEDIQLACRLNDSTLSDPSLVGGLVRMNCTTILIGPIWEGIAAHRWTDGQLGVFQTEFAQIDYLSEYSRSIRTERAVFTGLPEWIREDPRVLVDWASEPPPQPWRSLLPGVRFLPGWVDQNILNESRWLQESLSCVDVKTQRVYSQQALDYKEKLEKANSTPCTFIAKPWALDLDHTLTNFAFAQTFVNEAAIACAIERYRLAHGALPATLEGLNMAGLPHDIINGQPLHYRVSGDDYILYSVGWNGVDDGGKVGRKPDGRIDIAKGDWVWSLKPL